MFKREAIETPAPTTESAPSATVDAAAASLHYQQGNHPLQHQVNQSRQTTAPRPLQVQTKLVLGPVGDKYEQEADRISQEIIFRSSQANTPTATPQLSLQREAIATDTQVTSEIETTIRQAQGSGQTLPKTVQNAMGQALDTDFSSVRIHDDARADSLNHALQARAFTTGQDIFFRRGEYSPNSQTGQSLLAHELTHVVQQGASGPPPEQTQQSIPPEQQNVFSVGAKPVIQRLSVNNTNWGDATGVRPVTGDAKGGVLIFDEKKITGDKGSVVVKPGEAFVAENIIAANLGKSMADPKMEGKHASEKWSFQTPEMRIVQSRDEAFTMYKKAVDLLSVSKQKDEKVDRLLGNLNTPGAIVMSFMKGEDMKKLAGITQENAEWVPKYIDAKGDRKKDHILTQFINDRSLLEALGRVTAIDLFMGNGDRMVRYFAPQNMLIKLKSKKINLIDNIAEGEEAAFTTVGKLTGTWGLERWLKAQGLLIQPFITEAYRAIWTNVWGKLEDTLAPKINRVRHGQLEPEKIEEMGSWFTTGLVMGRDRLLTALVEPRTLLRDVPPDKKAEAYYSIVGRKLAIERKITDFATLQTAIEDYMAKNPLEGASGHTTTTTTTNANIVALMDQIG